MLRFCQIGVIFFFFRQIFQAPLIFEAARGIFSLSF